MANNDLTVLRDDYNEIQFTVKQSGAAYNLSGVTKIWFLVKNSPDDIDGSAVLTKTIANGGIVVTDAANGIGKVTIEGADLSSLLSTQLPLYYSLKLLSVASKPLTVAQGKFHVLATSVKAVS